MRRPEKKPKTPSKVGKAYLHTEVNPELRRLFRIHAWQTNQNMTILLHKLISKEIGREDLRPPVGRLAPEVQAASPN